MCLSSALVRRAVGRGWRKRCPHCGRGRLFEGWVRHLGSCAVCGLVYERNPGDTWAFTILFDRLPLGLMVALVYFGIFRASALLGVVAFVVLGAAFIISTPNRWGVGIALHYVSRVVWPDPVDPLPSTPARSDEDAIA
jgi:uncharacterized protein (DUF983 family)